MTPDEIEAARKEGGWFRMSYRCPACRAEWADEWAAACDADCPACGLSDITPMTAEEATP